MSTEEIKNAGADLCKVIIFESLDKIARFHAQELYEGRSSISEVSNLSEMAEEIADVLASLEACVCTCFNEGLHDSLKGHAVELCAAYYKELVEEE